MFKSIVNAVINTDSIAVKVVGYTALAAVGIGADIINTGAKKVETKEEAKVVEAPASTTEEVADEDIVMEVIHDEYTVTEVLHDEDTVVEVIHDEDTVTEVVNEDPEEPYDDSADRKAEDELFEAAIKSTSNSFELACEEAIETRKYGDEEAAVAMEEMAKLYLNYLQLNLGKEDEYLAVHNAKEALAAFRTFGPTRIEWM